MKNIRTVVVLGALGVILGGGGAYGSPVTVGGVAVSWDSRHGELAFSVSAPTESWIAIGFNSTDTIVGAELFMMRLDQDKPVVSHRQVVAAGDHRPVEQLGRISLVSTVSGRIRKGASFFDLTLRTDEPTYTGPQLVAGSELYLILAYSVSPDFDHHSRMRRHVRVRL